MTDPLAPLPQSGPTQAEPLAVPHSEFCSGLPRGRFHVIVNPEKARKYVRQRLLLVPILLPVVGIGAALAVAGHPWLGLSLIVAGVLAHRAITRQAPKILLHLTTKDQRTYLEAIEYEIMEVQLADQRY